MFLAMLFQEKKKGTSRKNFVAHQNYVRLKNYAVARKKIMLQSKKSLMLTKYASCCTE